MNKRQTGSEQERLACIFLEKRGVKLLELNYRNRTGEIDIIGKDGDYYVFFEVKYRKDANKGMPYEAVNFSKQKNICKVADFYRMTHGLGEFTPVRYDVISIFDDEIEWYKNAFEHIW